MYFVVSQIFKDKEMVGYKILIPESNEVINVPLENIREVESKKNVPFMNAYYKKDTGVLIGTQGSLTNYPSVYDNGIARDRHKKLSVVYEIIDKDTNKLGGYGVCDCYGMLINVKLDKFVSLCSKYEPSNFTLETKGSLVYAKSLGDKFYSVTKKGAIPLKGYNSKLGESGEDERKLCSEIKDSKQRNMLPTLNVYSYNDIKDNEFSVAAQDKLFKAYANMKKISPYYHTILMSVKRVATTAIETMAVTEDTMYYNMEFIASLLVSEITYILIHEVSHMAMRHSARHGSKDNELWNIACDLYINSIISRDFQCYWGTGEKEINTISGKGVIKVPNDGVHLSTINEVLDFGVDSPETIYARLLKENDPNNQSANGKNGDSSKDSGDGKDSSSDSGSKEGNQQSDKSGGKDDSSKSDTDENGDSSSSGKDEDGNEDSSSSGAGGDGKKDSNKSDTDENGDSSKSGKDGDGNDFEGSKSSSSKSSLGNDGVEVDQKDIYAKSKKVSVTYNGKKLEGTISMDVITSEIGDSVERNQRINEKSLQTTQGMKTAIEVKESKTGEPLVKNAGSGESIVQRCIDFGLSTQVNWKVLLANMCKSNPKKIYTMGSPNEVYMNSGVTVASRRKIGKNTSIAGIKVCVDVSGSVGEDELKKYLSEVNNIFRHYDIDGELIYWSTTIGDAGKFSDMKGMLKVSPITTGGTDVKCVFDYLSKKTRVNNKYEETRIKDISCVLIFTDGCFSRNYEDYARYFGKKVIWVIPSGKFMFEPLFGKVACMDDN